MDNISNTSIDEQSSSESFINIGLSRYICLILLSALLIPSILFSLYIFYWIYRISDLRNRLTNHIILAIFIISFIQTTCEMPFLLEYLRYGHVSFDSYSFCKFWIAFNYSLNTSILFLNSHLSIERYLLIFHHNFLNRHKMLIHYIPMTILIILAICYSCGTVLFVPCIELFDYTSQLCGGPCFQLQPSIGTFDLVFTVFSPLFCIIFFNSFLIIRVIQQKRRMLQKNVWKKNLGMLIQLLSVSILHVIVWLPVTIVILIAMTNYPPPAIIIELQTSWVLINIMYIAVLINPLVCFFAIPEIKEKIILFINYLRRKRQQQQQISSTGRNQIHPLSTNQNQSTRFQK
ncbi:unnamed protein product [Rotaria sp. Silwood1]|nr:unnamed protein product [Rotaria sp. Silwood1]CAF1502378.1 unnamed protein product [Rotaria sp. Silwood1]